MKKALLAFILAMCLAAGANAHQGMLALFADTNNHECHTALGVGQIGNLYLMYVRGDGPRMGNAYEFKLLRSSAGTVFLQPIWPPSIITDMIFGTIEAGISLVRPTCFEDQSYVPLGTIPIMNISDPDTFTVKVVPDPTQEPPRIVAILTCDSWHPAIYSVLGGIFVFNAGCFSPEDPYGVVATKSTTWGAVKALYQ